MDQDKVDMYIISNAKYFQPQHIPSIEAKLLELDNSKFLLVASLELKDPLVILMFSLFLGYLGIDRFIIGDTGAGIGKLLTFGGCGVWAFIDWFIISKRTRERNFIALMSIL